MCGELLISQNQQFATHRHPLANEIEGIPQAMAWYQLEQACFPKALENPILCPDPPHERTDISKQIANNRMNGFVTSYRDYLICKNLLNGARVDGVMEYCTPYYVPTTDFPAKNFTICDHWFAPLPASTLPNRLFASSGYSTRDVTPDGWVKSLKSLFGGAKAAAIRLAGSNKP
jgi:phospholipase C